MQKDTKLNKRVGNNIRMIRKSKGWNQEYLSKKLRMTRTNLTMIETGRQSLSIPNLVKLCKVFDCSLYAVIY